MDELPIYSGNILGLLEFHGEFSITLNVSMWELMSNGSRSGVYCSSGRAYGERMMQGMTNSEVPAGNMISSTARTGK